MRGTFLSRRRRNVAYTFFIGTVPEDMFSWHDPRSKIQIIDCGQAFCRCIVVSAADFVFKRRAERNEFVLRKSQESTEPVRSGSSTRGSPSSCQGGPVEPNRVDGRTSTRRGNSAGTYPRIRSGERSGNLVAPSSAKYSRSVEASVSFLCAHEGFAFCEVRISIIFFSEW
jgi:hypothetical protein